jgi:hypothetical protein
MNTIRLLATYNIWLRVAAGIGMPITKVVYQLEQAQQEKYTPVHPNKYK